MGSMGINSMMGFQIKMWKLMLQGSNLIFRGRRMHKLAIGATLAKLFLLGTQVV